jgi:hypothetical protein
MANSKADMFTQVIALVAGIIFSPHATNLVKPLEFAGSEVKHLVLDDSVIW